MYKRQVHNWTVNADQKYELGPKGLDLKHLERYYKYDPFELLQFKNQQEAKRQFERIIEASSFQELDRMDPKQELYWKIFSKAGSTYILYGHMIIYHKRRCGFNEKIEVPKEDNLCNYLFTHNPTSQPYFVRIRCGWTKAELK